MMFWDRTTKVEVPTQVEQKESPEGIFAKPDLTAADRGSAEAALGNIA